MAYVSDLHSFYADPDFSFFRKCIQIQAAIKSSNFNKLKMCRKHYLRKFSAFVLNPSQVFKIVSEFPR